MVKRRIWLETDTPSFQASSVHPIAQMYQNYFDLVKLFKGEPIMIGTGIDGVSIYSVTEKEDGSFNVTLQVGKGELIGVNVNEVKPAAIQAAYKATGAPIPASKTAATAPKVINVGDGEETPEGIDLNPESGEDYSDDYMEDADPYEEIEAELNAFTVVELKQIATDRDIELSSSMNKSDIVGLLYLSELATEASKRNLDYRADASVEELVSLLRADDESFG